MAWSRKQLDLVAAEASRFADHSGLQMTAERTVTQLFLYSIRINWSLVGGVVALRSRIPGHSCRPYIFRVLSKKIPYALYNVCFDSVTSPGLER